MKEDWIFVNIYETVQLIQKCLRRFQMPFYIKQKMVTKPKICESTLAFTKAWQQLAANNSNIDLSVNQAWEIVKNQLFKPTIESCQLVDATGRILAEDVYADRDFPPFNRVAMDGICIRFEDFNSGARDFSIVGIQPAGSPQLDLPNGFNAFEVMTGASLPYNSDTVIRYEDIKVDEDKATIQIEDIRMGQNVHNKGLDRKQNDLLLRKGTELTFAEIGVLATVGISKVSVLSKPKIAIVSTGDELVDVEETPLPHQIRKSNVFSLQSILSKFQIVPSLVHVPDEKDSIANIIGNLLNNNDVVLFSGAVSKGKFDFLPEVLSEAMVIKHFHRVQQRPGKPFWFGSRSDVVVFAFPGNPVSTAVCAKRYLEPWLRICYGLPVKLEYAVLERDIEFKPSLQYFVPVVLHTDGATLNAKPSPGHGSGDLANLSDANAFIELPANESVFKKGSIYPIWRW
jgi:molybdopterin molybdotransferase